MLGMRPRRKTVNIDSFAKLVHPHQGEDSNFAELVCGLFVRCFAIRLGFPLSFYVPLFFL